MQTGSCIATRKRALKLGGSVMEGRDAGVAVGVATESFLYRVMR
jgi:hypothetical protein